MSWYKYNLLADYKRELTYGSEDVSVLNRQIEDIMDHYQSAVKGDYYGFDLSDFGIYKEETPDNDSRIQQARSYIQREMDEIKREIEEEEARKREAEKKAREAASKKP